MRPLWLIGGGGHARVVIDAARSSGTFDVVGVLDDDWEPGMEPLDGVPVRGPITPASVEHFGVKHAVVAIGSNRARYNIADRLDGLVCWEPVIHAATWVATTARVEPGSVIFAGAVVQPGTVIGTHAIINTAASVDHDCWIGDFCHIAPGAHVAAEVTIEAGALIGLGAAVVPRLMVGSWAIVGAASAVVRNVPANAVAVGVPAKIIKEHEPGWQFV